MILSSLKRQRCTCFTQQAQRYASLLQQSIILALQAKHMQSQCLCRMMLLHTSPAARNNCFAPISATIESSATWLPKSPDLNLCNFQLRGYLKTRGLPGPGPGWQMSDDFSNRPGQAGKWEAIFPKGWAGPGRQMKGDFSNGPGC